MRHSIQRLTPAETLEVIYKNEFHLTEGKENGVWQEYISSCSATWIGIVEGEIACIWGIIPPTLLSDRCYLWLFTTKALIGNEFRFIRCTQRWVEELLKEYPMIVGHVRVGQDRSIRWLKWLGAVMEEPEGFLIPFAIRKK